MNKTPEKTEGRNVRCPQCDVTYWLAEFMVQNILNHETRCFACNSVLELADKEEGPT
jgi:uncharacterized protein with PIN domain